LQKRPNSDPEEKGRLAQLFLQTLTEESRLRSTGDCLRLPGYRPNTRDYLCSVLFGIECPMRCSTEVIVVCLENEDTRTTLGSDSVPAETVLLRASYDSN